MRFEVDSGKVTDTLTDADVILLPMDEEKAQIYEKAKFSPGFLQPLARVDEGVVCEEWDYHEMATVEEDEDIVKRKFLPLLLALAFLHNEGCVYGSLAPTKVIETDDGYYLKDIGEGKEIENQSDYSALEFTFFQGEGTFQSDVYSVSAMMYEKLSGIHLPSAEERKNEEEELEPLSAFGITEKTEAAIEKGLSLYADDRWETIEDFIAALYDEKNLEGYKNDFSILIRPIRVREEEILEREYKKKQKEEEEEPKEEIEEKVKRPIISKKQIYLLGGILVLVLLIFLIKPFLMDSEEEEPIVLSQIKQTALPVEDELKITLITPPPAVSGSAVSGGAVSGSAVSPPAVTITPQPTPKPTKKPKKTPKPTPKPTPTKRPYVPPRTPTPRRTEPPSVDGGDVVI